MEFRVNCAKREYNEVQIWEDFRKRNEKQNDLYRDILKAEYKGYQPKQYFHDYIHEKNYRPKEGDSWRKHQMPKVFGENMPNLLVSAKTTYFCSKRVMNDCLRKLLL